MPKAGYDIMAARIDQAERLVDLLMGSAIDAEGVETMETDPEKLDYAVDENDLKQRWRLILKAEIMNRYLDLEEEYQAEGKTIVLTTHYMEEAQRLCDEVAIMDHGKIIAQGTPQELIRKHTAGITVSLPKTALSKASAAIGRPHRQGGDRVEFRTRDANSCLSDLLSAGVDLADVAVRTPSLETVFLNLTGRQLRE